MAFKRPAGAKKTKNPSKKKLPDTRKEEDLSKVYSEIGKHFCTDFTVEFLHTGSFALDYLWTGGLPRGRITEIASPPGCGKTTLVIHVLNAICRAGFHGVYLDSEHAMSTSLVTGSRLMQHYEKLFWYYQVSTYDDLDYLFDQYLQSTRSSRPAVLVVDSISSIQTETQRTEGHNHIKIGGDARPCGDFLRKWKGFFARNKVALILINQCRETINTAGSWGDPSVKYGGGGGLKPWGGQALRHWTDNRTWLDEESIILSDPDDPDSIIGRDLKIRCSKNKQGPMRKGLLSLIFGKGISTSRTLRNWLLEANLIEQKGAWFEPISTINPEGHKFHGQRPLEEWIQSRHAELLGRLKEGGYLE